MTEISFKEFQQLDLRVGKIVEAERIEGSRNLLKLKVDFGEGGQRTAVAGLAQHCKPEQLVGKKYMFILNLERRNMMGVESECMIFAAEDAAGKLALMMPEKDIEAGSRIH
jgi:methionine--tRNA ligase beta chain